MPASVRQRAAASGASTDSARSAASSASVAAASASPASSATAARACSTHASASGSPSPPTICSPRSAHACGGVAVAARELGARQRRVHPRAPARLDRGEVRQPDGAHGGQAAVDLAEVGPQHAQVRVRGAREHAVVEPVEQGHRLVARGARAVDVAEIGHRPRVGDQREDDELPVAGQPRGLDRAVGRLGRLGEEPARLQRVREPDHHRHHELALADRAREVDPAPQVADRVVVVLAEELREAEVVRRVEPQHELVVGQRVDQRRALRCARRRPPPASPRLYSAKHSSAVASASSPRSPSRRAVSAARAAHCAHRLEVAVVERVGGQLGVQGGGRRAVLVVERLERVEQPRVGGVVAAEQVLARRARGDQAHAQVGQLDQRQRLDQRLQRALEPAGGGQRAGQRDEQPEPAPRVATRRRRAGAARPRTSGRRSPARGRRPGGRPARARRRPPRRRPSPSARRGARAPPARPAGRRARPRRGRAPPAATPRRRRRTPRGARAGGGSGSGAGRRSARRCWPASSWSIAASVSRSSMPAAAPARSRSNGSPATAAPQPSRRAGSGRPAISWPSAAATAGGTPTCSASAPGSAAAGAGARASSSR